ncbi:MAG: hydroxymethylpyrimidine/phosphomethylpyrimidine kinase [Alphaproteobacteria bacterium]|nr:hydroxymethylpyrimidine/phosphomethylpyrimidine kinase [Alphaproteobacteria bacterium]
MAVSSTRHVLVIGGSDSSGGAGIARDIETVAAFGVRSAIAVTAITAQTHDQVRTVEPVSPSLVVDQMRGAMDANPVAAIKIGMMATAGIVSAIAEVLSSFPSIPTVLDPVISSTSGARLLSEEGTVRLRCELMPHCILVTPNLPELAILVEGGSAGAFDEVAGRARVLLNRGVRGVLVKGGHAEGSHSIDSLYRPGRAPIHFSLPRREGLLRGTGCMLASAIAANLALGFEIDVAIRAAKALVDRNFTAAGYP